jgi:hypothetical protein
MHSHSLPFFSLRFRAVVSPGVSSCWPDAHHVAPASCTTTSKLENRCTWVLRIGLFCTCQIILDGLRQPLTTSHPRSRRAQKEIVSKGRS